MVINTTNKTIKDNTIKHKQLTNFEEDIILNGMFGINPFKNKQLSKNKNSDLLKWLTTGPVILICILFLNFIIYTILGSINCKNNNLRGTYDS